MKASVSWAAAVQLMNAGVIQLRITAAGLSDVTTTRMMRPPAAC